MDHDATGAACTAEGCDLPAGDAAALPPTGGTLDIVSDAICPWCWIGKRHLDAALAELAAEGLIFAIRWRTFQLNPDMPAAGVERDAYRAAKFGSAERGRELDRQVAGAGTVVGLEFRHDRMLRTPNTVEAHRLVRLAEGPGQHALVERLFRAYFHEGQDIGDRVVLAALAREQAVPEPVIAAFEAGEPARAEVLREDAQFRAAGISGVPSFVLDRYLLWSGAMPAAQMADALRRARAAIDAERARAA